MENLRDRHEKLSGILPRPQRKRFPMPSPRLLEDAALVTLCLWGDVRDTRAALDYLTPETRDILRRMIEGNRILGERMKEISDHCPFGPDGRAANDWLTAAIGDVLSSGSPTFRGPGANDKLLEEALRRTAVISLSHKIFDNFSPASRPDLTRKKEQAIRYIVDAVFNRHDRPGSHVNGRARDASKRSFKAQSPEPTAENSKTLFDCSINAPEIIWDTFEKWIWVPDASTTAYVDWLKPELKTRAEGGRVRRRRGVLPSASTTRAVGSARPLLAEGLPDRSGVRSMGR